MGIKYQIIIEIDEDDTVTLETRGFKGQQCQDEIKSLTKNFAKIEKIEKTKEFYEKVKSKLNSKKHLLSK